MKVLYQFICILTILLCSACGFLQEGAKTFWGSSIRALAQARPEGIRATYSCIPEACFDKVLAMTYVGEKPKRSQGKDFRLFLKDRRAGHIVIMEVPGAVDTTEVGIFFDAVGSGQTQVEIASLSSAAVSVTAEIIFAILDQDFVRNSSSAKAQGTVDD